MSYTKLSTEEEPEKYEYLEIAPKDFNIDCITIDDPEIIKYSCLTSHTFCISNIYYVVDGIRYYPIIVGPKQKSRIYNPFLDVYDYIYHITDLTQENIDFKNILKSIENKIRDYIDKICTDVKQNRYYPIPEHTQQKILSDNTILLKPLCGTTKSGKKYISANLSQFNTKTLKYSLKDIVNKTQNYTPHLLFKHLYWERFEGKQDIRCVLKLISVEIEPCM